MLKKYALILFFLTSVYNGVSQIKSSLKSYEIWDDQPAPNSGGDIHIKKADGYPYDRDWEHYSYPLGNGYMGANFFGRTDSERIQITEKTLLNKSLYALGGITNFLEVFLDFNHTRPLNYKRSVDLNQAVGKVSYQNDGVQYKREYFISYPDRVMLIKLSADQKNKISFTLRPEIPYVRDSITRYMKTGQMVAEGDLIRLWGLENYFSVNYEAQIKVIPQGGKLQTKNDGNSGTIQVTDADRVILIIATGTNYELNEQVFLTKRNDHKLDIKKTPHELVTSLIDNAQTTGYDQLKSRHIDDYQNLFNRVKLNLNNSSSELSTPDLLDRYQNGEASFYLEELLFQFGRYLLISSSRKGTLPSGLQGVWSQYEVSPWTGGYWHNINIQMNYWGAMNCNLAETFIPYIEYFEAYHPMAEKHASRYIERKHPDKWTKAIHTNGWTIGTAANCYKIRAAGGHSGPGTGGMTSKLFWEYYDFTRDTTYLKNTGYKALLGMSQFLSKTVLPDQDGTLLVKNSASPEQMHDGKYYMTEGSTFDQGFVWENHNDFLKAAKILDIHSDFTEMIENQMQKLDPIKIGKSGQIKEFREEIHYGDIGEKQHRHVSHLCPLYPGTLINSQTKDWINAAQRSLDLRGNSTTGWGMAHRLNLRARTKDGEQSYLLVKKILSERTLPNLWTTHPPFQIDANFGYMAGIAEMLIQSHEGYIEPLPALPVSWGNGDYSGLVARGNFVLSVKWNQGKITSIHIESRSGGVCKIKVPGNASVKVSDHNNSPIVAKAEGQDIILFNTDQNRTYMIQFTD